jgi:hypothetical protein
VRKSTAPPRTRYLLVGRPALPDQALAVLEAGDEAHAIEQRPVERPVLDLPDIFEENRAMAVPRARRHNRHAVVPDIHPVNPDERIIAVPIIAAADRRAGGQRRGGREHNEVAKFFHR